MTNFKPGIAATPLGAIHSDLAAALAWTPRGRRRLLVALLLLAADLTASTVAVGIAAVSTGRDLLIGVVVVIGSTLLQSVLGLYGGYGPSPCERLRLRVRGLLLFGALGCLSAFFTADYGPLAFLAVALPLALVTGYYTESLARAFLIRRRLWGAPAAFVGFGRANRQLATFLTLHPEFGINPVAVVRTASEQGGAGVSFLPVLGDIGELEAIACRVEMLVFGSAEDAGALSLSVRQRLNATELVIVADSAQVQSLWLNTRTLGGAIGLELRRSQRAWSRATKRLTDLVLAVPACILAAPILALASIAIRVVDGGPSLYSQDRVGADGKTIRIYKLRTMFKDAEQRLEAHLAANPRARAQWQRYFKLTDDPRILPGIGSFLRRTSLDELPQLWTVVWGRMSLVGPRPFPAYHVGCFDPDFQAIRAMVPPGLSGLWQVGARSDGDLEIQRAQDLFYILNWSIWLDLYVLMETPLAVLGARGAR